MRLFYVDDSGASATRTAVFGWIELDTTNWRAIHRSWLDWRYDLYRTLGIPTDYELHCTKFVGGRGHPTGTDWDARKSERAPVLTATLARMSSIPGLGFGAVYVRADSAKEHRDLKIRCYRELVQLLDDRLARDGEDGMVVMDGDGTDLTYRVPHRGLSLDSCGLIEDPIFRAGHDSQWVQMADLVAYAAYMRVARIPGKEAAWSWYADHLSNAVTGPEPLRLTVVEKS